ncbi:MAG: SUMF1/EgtB/PvdO family nonheme iron enzyme [Cytophagales bacterium]|nr:SUMF1/EgtB/PvdO family nonheme iron enzyme [Cytophagales bacterium]
MGKWSIKFFRALSLVMFCLVNTAVKAPENYISKEETWGRSVLEYQKLLRKHSKKLRFKPYRSPELNIRDKAHPVRVDVSNMDYIRLIVDGSENGNAKDHAAWGNARFIDTGGNSVFADKIPVIKESQGWGGLTFDQNLMGSEILIGNAPYEKGIAMHAEGYAIFKLDKKYKSFEAEVGVEQKGGNRSSSVIFKVEDYLSEILFDDLENKFPTETKLFKRLAKKSSTLIFSPQAGELIDRVAEEINDKKGIKNIVKTGKSSKERLNSLSDMFHVWLAMEKIERAHPQSTLEVYNHLTEKYGEKYLKLLATHDVQVMNSFQEEYDKLIERLKRADTEAIDEAERISETARRIHLSNPLLRDKSIVLIRHKLKNNARSAMANNLGYPANNWTTSASIQNPDQGWNNDLVILSDVLNPKIKSIYKPENPVLLNDPDLHWDGQRILFSSIGENGRWGLFEIKTDGTGLKKLTPDGYDDLDFFDGCYLPNGKIAMVSTAPYQGVPCVGGSSQTGSLYLLDPRTQNIRQLNFGQDHDWNPVVLNNGKIMYLRWEYTDAAHYFTRILMSMNPDGTSKKEYYGSSSYWPNSVFEAHPIPGSSSKFSGIVSGHHGTVRSGRLVIFDPKKGRQEADGVVQEIPFKNRKVEPVIKDRLVDGVWPQFLSAYPLDENFYLANVKPGPKALWGLYLVDVFDNMTLITENEGEALMYPMLLKKRTVPPVIPDKVKLNDSTSTVYIANIYEGPGLKGVPKGSVEKLRLFAYHFTYNKSGGHDALGIQAGWDVKRVLGTVPVEKDGSAIFKIPANTPVSLQPLDENGRAMQIMRSWFTGMPGEIVSCVGCHESQNTLPPVRPTIASRKLPDAIEPFYGDVRPFTFANEIQPILDRKCASCHDGSNDLPNFCDKEESGYRNLSGSYKALHPFVRRPGPESDLHVLIPMDYHAGTSELIQKLEKGHHNVILSEEEWDRLHTWIDLNVPYHGQFEAEEFCEYDQKERRQELAAAFGGRPIDIEKELEIAAYLRSLQDTAPVKPEKREAKIENAPDFDDWKFNAEEAKALQDALGVTKKTIPMGNGLDLELVKVPSGEYTTNANGGSEIVKIDKPFWIGRFEITNEQYKFFFPDHDSRYIDQFWKDHTTRGYPANKPEQPVVRISWEESMEFCKRLSEKTGLKFSLPTAEQWEWACRAGSAEDFWFGALNTDFTPYENLADESLSDFAVVGVNPRPMSKNDHKFPYYNFIPQAPYNDGEMIAASVGKYAPNPWGLHDMHGNVSEWVLNDHQLQPGSVIEPGKRKTVKGGSWRDRPYRSAADATLNYSPWQKVFNVGFRVVMEE